MATKSEETMRPVEDPQADDTQQLYNNLKEDGYEDIGTLDEFRANVANREMSDQLYNNLKEDGYEDLGTSDEFFSRLNPSEPSSETNDATGEQAVPNATGEQTMPNATGVQTIDPGLDVSAKLGASAGAEAVREKPSPETVPGTQEWRANTVNIPGDNPYNGRTYGEVYDSIISDYGKNLSHPDIDPYAEARAQIMQSGIADDMKPEDADNLALNIREGYANRYADNGAKQMIASLPDQVPNIDQLMDGLWYTRDMQGRIAHEARRLGLRTENYVNYYVKPHIAKALSDRYGYDVDSAKHIAARLLSQEGHTMERVRQNEAAEMIGRYAEPKIQSYFDRALQNAEEQFANAPKSAIAAPEASIGLNISAAADYYRATDPAKVWEMIRPNIDQMSKDIIDTDFILEAEKHAEEEGVDINSWLESRVLPMMQSQIQSQFEQMAIEREMPKNTMDYILANMQQSLMGTVARAVLESKTRRRMKAEALQRTEAGQGVYNPGFGAKVAGGAAAMLPDMLLPGGGPFGLTAKLATKPVQGMAQTLIADGMRPLLARMTQSSISGGLSLGAFEGLKGGIEETLTPSDYTDLMEGSDRSASQILKDVLLNIVSGEDAKRFIKGAFERGVPSGFSGLAMVGGPLGQKISNGRGVLANALGWGTQVGVDAAGATALSTIPKIVQGDVDWKEVGRDFASNVGTFAALGLHGKAKEFASLAKGGKAWNGVEFTKKDIDLLEDRYLQPLRKFITETEEAQKKRGLIGRSTIGIDADQELRDAVNSAGAMMYNDIMRSYAVPRELKVKVAQALGMDIPEYAMKPDVVELEKQATAKGIEMGWIDAMNYDYNKPGGVADKARNGDPLTDSELTLRLLFQDNKAFNEALMKQQSGEPLTEQEQELVSTNLNRMIQMYREYAKEESGRLAHLFEEEHGMAPGSLSRMMKDAADGKAVDSNLLNEYEEMLRDYNTQLDEARAIQDAEAAKAAENTAEVEQPAEEATAEEAPKVNRVVDNAEGEIPVGRTDGESTSAAPPVNQATGKVTEVELVDGRKAYVTDGDPNNPEGLISLVDENGQPIKIERNGYTFDRFSPEIIQKDEKGAPIINEVKPDAVKAESSQSSAEAADDSISAKYRIPLNENAEPDYEQAKPEDTYDALVEEFGEDYATALINSEISDAQRRIPKPRPAESINIPNGVSMAEKARIVKQQMERQKNQQQADQQAADKEQAKIDYWKSVLGIPAQRKAEADHAARMEKMQTPEGRAELIVNGKNTQERAQIAKEIYGDYFNENVGEPDTAEELVSMLLPYGKLNWEGYDRGTSHVRGLQEELGSQHTRGLSKDKGTSGFNSYLAKKGEGESLDDIVHDMYVDNANLSGEEHRFTTEEIKDAVIDMLLSAEKPTDIRDYTINSRIDRAEKAMRGELEREADAAKYEETESGEQAVSEEPAAVELPFEAPANEASPFLKVSSDDTPADDIDKATTNKLVETIEKAGVPVSTDIEEGQAVIDRYNQSNDLKQQKVDQPIFVSNAMKAVEGISQEKATPEQWLAMIQKNGGLKAGEDKWIGLSDWLNEQKEAGKKSVTKQEVEDYIRQNQIQVEEKQYHEVPQGISNKLKDLNKEYTDICNKLFYEIDDPLEIADKAFEQMKEKYGEDFENAVELVSAGHNVFEIAPQMGIDDLPTGDAMRFLGIDPTHVINDTRLSYTTKGLDNYKEIALTVPTIEPYNEGDQIHFGDAGGGRAVAWIRFGDAYYNKNGEPTEVDRQWNDFMGKMAEKYGKDRNDTLGLLTEMTDEERETMNKLDKQITEKEKRNMGRVLVIDEIQSKRHQDAREKGYADGKAVKAYNDWMDAKANEYGVQRYQVESRLSDEEYSEMKRLQEAAKIDNGVPDAPFEKNWHELAMKRMLRYAAENGYDKIAWTTGDQQAERYDIGNVVEKIISYDYPEVNDPDGRKTKKIEVRLKDGETMTMRVDQNGKVIEGRSDTEGKNLSDVVGKDLARRIMGGEGKDGTIFDANKDLPAKVIEGEGLRIGSDGMKGFYDDILPRFMDKYGKKWGVKTGEIDLPDLEKSAQKMHSIDVTPEMKESVMQGQPMFFKTPDGHAYGFTYRGKIYIDPRIATSETPIHEYGHLWAEMKRQTSPDEWNHIKDVLLKDKLIEPIIEKVRREYPELEGKEDDFVEEVLTQFSGKHGAEKLRQMAEQIKQEMGNDAAAETIAEAAIRRVKSVLNEFWKGVADMMGWKYTSAEDIADRILSDMLNGVNPTEKMKEAPKDLKGQQEIERTLMGVHNLTEEKLRKALKVGGLANPSMAVVDTNQHMHTDYGEISLIPKASLIDARTGRNAGTFTADAWTPSYPQVVRRMTDKGQTKFWKDIRKLDEEAGDVARQMRMAFDTWLDKEVGQERLAYWYLSEKGLKPELVLNENRYGKDIANRLDELTDDGNKMVSSLPEDQIREIADMYHAYKEKIGEPVTPAEERIKKLEERIDPNKQTPFSNLQKFRLEELQKYGELLHNLSDFTDRARRSAYDEGKPNVDATMRKAQEAVESQNLQADFDKWLDQKAQDYGIEEWLYNGTDSQGRQKWVRNTLDNASKLMKKEGLNGAVGWSSLGSWIATVANKEKTLEGIRKNKKNLNTSEEEHDAWKEQWSEKLYPLVEKLGNGDVFHGDNILKDILEHKDFAGYYKREYGKELTQQEKDLVNTFIKEVRTNFPTGYFETKFERPVGLDEFEIAVIPETTSPDIVEALKNAGLDVRTYDASDYDKKDENRTKVAMDAVSGRDDIRFQMVGRKGAEKADEADNDSERVRTLNVAKDATKAGIDPKAIKFATGWEKGKDGKWRYEIPDADVDILGAYKQARLAHDKEVSRLGKEEDALLQKYQQLGDKIPARLDNRYTEEQKEKYRQMREQREELWKQYIEAGKKATEYDEQGVSMSLGELLGEGNDLFKYYPEMKDMRVRFATDMEGGTAGSFGDNGIDINYNELHRFDGDDLNNESVYGILLHEVQHAIQDIEGFAPGGNLYTSTTREGINAIIEKKERQRADIKTKLDANRRILDNPEELKLAAELDGKTEQEVKDKLQETVDQQAYEYDNLGLQIDRLRHTKSPDMSDARDLYNRLAGEVESRNVTNRMNMSPEERRNSLASETEDIPREDQVIINGRGGASASLADSGKVRFVDQMTDEEKSGVRKRLEETDALPATEKAITKREGVSARNAAMEWAEKNIPEPKTVSTEIGDLVISKKSISDSLAHGFSQAKLDAIPTLLPAFEEGRAVYIGSGDDVNGDPITDHYFAYPIDYNGDRRYVFCRTREDQNTHRLYIHEVITGEDINKGQTLQSTAPEKPRTGLPLYRNIMSDVFGGKDTKNTDTIQEKSEKSASEAQENKNNSLKFQKVGSPEPEMTPEERQYWNKWAADMKKWREQNAIPEGTEEPVEKPKKQPDEDMIDYVLRLTQYNKDKAVWKTAPKLDDYLRQRSDKDMLEAAKEDLEKYPESPLAKMRVAAAEFQQIRTAMGRQKAYDKATVKAVTDFAQEYMKLGFGDNLSRGEIERMLSSVKNATGAKDIRKEVDNIMNILTDNYLRNLDQQVQKLSSTKELKQTAQGVEAQGKLELKGQRMIQAFREARQTRMTADEIRERMAEVSEYMARNDDEAPMWEQEYEGLSIALQYVENIDGSRSEYGALDREYKDAVKNYKESGRSYKAQQEYLDELDKAMMENKLERIGMFGDLIGRLQGNIAESMQGAREFVEREKQRIAHIQKIANFDLAGKDMGAMRERGKGKPANFFLQPLATFEQMLKQFGSRNANGEGYLYDHFMRTWMDATDNAFKGEQRAKQELDEKAKEVFGDDIKRWSDLYKLIRNEKEFPGMDVEITDQGEEKEFHLNQGNLLYIYMADKMTDGRMKLRKMGITEEDVDAIKEHLDPRLVQLGDWLQDEYLVQKRTEYNKVHERMFGAPMAAIDHYFPIRILGDARVQEQDVANMADQDAVLPSTITGNIIKRRRNSLPLDILHTDALSLAIEHIEDMERWAATAEWNKDINTLLSYTTFRNKVKNMKTIYGSGDALWNTFADTARMAAGTYRPKAKPGSVDKTISNIAKGVTAAKISFRAYTAFKQTLSAPAFLHDVNLGYFIKNSVNPYGSWKWAMENMPVFEKRWKSRQVGDTRLMDDPTDWKMWKTDTVKLAAQLGMSPNALVDGITCAVGARSIYQSRVKKYKDMGMDEEKSEKRALQDAEIGYNLTQQSSEGAFVSAIQKDRTVAANMLSVFRNSSMAYTRQWVDAARNLKHRMKPSYREDSIGFMAKQFEEILGLDEAKAQEAAEKEYARAARHDIARMLNMMFGVTVAWNLGASLPYLLIGDDDETKKEMLTDAFIRGMVAGPTEGFAAGNIISELVGRSIASEETRKTFKKEGLGAAIDEGLKQAGDYEINPLPLMADIQGMIEKMGYDKYAMAQDLFNIVMQSAVGVNPQTFTDIWNACMDYGNPSWMPFTDSSVGNDDMANAKEIALFIMRLTNAPTSSWRNKYIDELGMGVDEAKNLSYDEMARRYANYKHWKDAPVMGWFRSDEARQEKMKKIVKQFDKAVQERMGRLKDEDLARTFDNTNDLTERKMLGKEEAKRTDSEDKVAGGIKSIKSDEKRKAVERYVKHRTWQDLLDDLELAKAKRNMSADYKERREEAVRQSVADAKEFDKDKANKQTKQLLKDIDKVEKDIKKLREAIGTDDNDDDRWKEIRSKRDEILKKIRDFQQK